MDSNTLMQFLPLVVLFGIMYFFMIRPQQKKAKETNEMRRNIKRGDKVSTGGGVIGKVVKVKDDVVTIESGRNRTQFEVLRTYLNVIEVAPVSATRYKKPEPEPVEEEYEEIEENYEEYDDAEYEEYDEAEEYEEDEGEYEEDAQSDSKK